MSRKSRFNIEPSKKETYKVGAYVRISKARDDNDTIENQKNIVLNFINNFVDFELVEIYEDNDKTGTNFQRNGFQQLINDIKLKKINCVIVKDLSRFGRDYKECCNYIENIFPFLKVRFIAINENFDTNDLTSNDILNMQLKNLVNDTYSKDISKKILASLKTKKENGQYLGFKPPYGYLKDPNDKYKLIVDEEVRLVIEMIFNLRIEGKSYREIILELNRLKIDCPSKHFYKLGILKNPKYANIDWSMQTITSILKNEFYIGTLIQGKSIRRLENNYKKINVPKENWIVIKNNHSPIIDEEIFNKVQEINKYNFEIFNNYKKYDDEENIFKSILICGICGKRLHLSRHKYSNKNVYLRYECRCNTSIIRKCTFTSINKKTLDNVVLESIKLQIKICNNIVKILRTDEYKSKVELEKIQLNDKLNELNLKINKIKNFYDSLYEDYLTNFISKDDYIYSKSKYKEKEKLLLEEISNLNDKLKSINKKSLDNKFLNNILQIKDKDILNRDIILKLIEKITIYSPSRIEITFKFLEDFNVFENNLKEYNL